MSNLFIKTIVQYGGNLTESEKVVMLNTISKYINKKMKILEYKYGIKLKLSNLPIDNWDILPKSVAINTFANIDGPLKGQIPIYTKANLNIPTPTISPVTVGVPVGVPVVGVTGVHSMTGIASVPGLSINPFGNANNLEERIQNASKYFDIITDIDNQLDELKNGSIEKKKVDTKYFEFVDLEEPELTDELNNLLEKKHFSKDL